MMQTESGWATKQECEFIDGLGHHSQMANKPSRAVLLRQYQRSLAKRTDWGNINRFDVERHCVAAVERLILS